MDVDLKKLLIAYAAAFIGPFGGNAVIPLFSLLETELNTSYALITLSITFMMIPFAIIQFFSGTISDFFNRQVICAGGLLIYGIGALVIAISQTFEIFIFGRIIQGLGYGILFPVTVALVGDLSSPSQRGKIMGFFGACTTAGVAFGPLSAGFLAHFGWQIIFYIIAGVSILIGITLWFCFRDFPLPSPKKRGVREFFSQMKNTITKNILLFAIIGFIIFMSYIGVNASIGERYSLLFPALPENQISSETGLILAAAGISGIIISPFAGLSTDKFGRKTTAYIGAIILTISLSLFSLGNSFLSFFILFYCMGTGAAVIWAAFNTLTVELDPMAKGTVSSIANGFRFLGYH